MSLLLYNIVLHTLVAPFLAAYYLPQIAVGRKYRRSLAGKLGLNSSDFPVDLAGSPRIWFHAVSVGEVVALGPLVTAVKEIFPTASLIVSTGTETGQDKARGSIPEADGFLYLPLDFPSFVNPVIERIRPDLFVLMETELWPNLVGSLKGHGVAIALVNGRISDRSFPRYRFFRRFFASTLGAIDLFLMASEMDAQRVLAMGAPEGRIVVTGNTKFDASLRDITQDSSQRLCRLLDLNEKSMIWVAGSTHPGEHETVLDVYERLSQKFPELILILAPRHVEKTPSIVEAMKERSMAPPLLFSSAEAGEKRNGRKVVIVDRTGELFEIYSLATGVFVGGSLVPKGGQNILEPAAWGKTVLFGPSMEDFREARDILISAGAGIEVRGAEDLADRVRKILSDPQTASELGTRGREAVLKHVGSARRNAVLLADHLEAKAVPLRGFTRRA